MAPIMLELISIVWRTRSEGLRQSDLWSKYRFMCSITSGLCGLYFRGINTKQTKREFLHLLEPQTKMKQRLESWRNPTVMYFLAFQLITSLVALAEAIELKTNKTMDDGALPSGIIKMSDLRYPIGTQPVKHFKKINQHASFKFVDDVAYLAG